MCKILINITSGDRIMDYFYFLLFFTFEGVCTTLNNYLSECTHIHTYNVLEVADERYIPTKRLQNLKVEVGVLGLIA